MSIASVCLRSCKLKDLRIRRAVLQEKQEQPRPGVEFRKSIHRNNDLPVQFGALPFNILRLGHWSHDTFRQLYPVSEMLRHIGMTLSLELGELNHLSNLMARTIASTPDECGRHSSVVKYTVNWSVGFGSMIHKAVILQHQTSLIKCNTFRLCGRAGTADLNLRGEGFMGEPYSRKDSPLWHITSLD